MNLSINILSWKSGEVLNKTLETYQINGLLKLTDDVKINWVWMPPWGPDKITDDGRDQLRALGFTV